MPVPVIDDACILDASVFDGKLLFWVLVSREPAMHPRIPYLVLFAAVIAGSCFAADTSDDIGRQSVDVDFSWGVEIPMADGVTLNGTLYRPKDWEDREPGALPTIVTITPYISDRYHPDALYFARHGFAFLIVDTRGRGNSEGEFRPLDLEDGKDGRDVVQWIAGQPWSNGKVGMRGGSYGGYNQWVTASARNSSGTA